MDSRVAIMCLTLLLALMLTCSEGRKKKVVIHVPYKVKKIKHTHTVYKTIHHHRGRPGLDHISSPSDEHEHFHHMHLHDEMPMGSHSHMHMGLHDEMPMGAHSQPVGGLAIPDFLPDLPMDVPDIPDVPREIPGLNRLIPLYRRA